MEPRTKKWTSRPKGALNRDARRHGSEECHASVSAFEFRGPHSDRRLFYPPRDAAVYFILWAVACMKRVLRGHIMVRFSGDAIAASGAWRARCAVH